MIENIKKNENFDEYDIFKYFLPNSNTILSSLKGIDLQDLLVLLDEVTLLLRDNLGFEKNITFGLEIEMEHVNEKVKNIIDTSKAFKDWTYDHDGSLVNGLEVISPVLTDTKSNWEILKQLCNELKKYGKIDTRSGGHVHIGTQILGKECSSILNFLKLWSSYENIIYRFSYGEFLTPRPVIMNFAAPTAEEFMEIYNLMKDEKNIREFENEICSFNKSKAVNFYCASFDIDSSKTYEIYNTIEFRNPNGTLEPVIWQNNVNLFVKLLKYSRNTKYDDDIVTKRYENNLNKYFDFENYNEIYLEQALELCDLIFNNNLDKIYFLRQYLKSLEMPTQEFQKAKKFVRS